MRVGTLRYVTESDSLKLTGIARVENANRYCGRRLDSKTVSFGSRVERPGSRLEHPGSSLERPNELSASPFDAPAPRGTRVPRAGSYDFCNLLLAKPARATSHLADQASVCSDRTTAERSDLANAERPRVPERRILRYVLRDGIETCQDFLKVSLAVSKIDTS